MEKEKRNTEDFSQKIMSAMDLKPCIICGRRFPPNRIDTHENICKKTSNTTRIPFDIHKQKKAREMEDVEEEEEGKEEIPPCLFSIYLEKPHAPALTTNWRAKHEMFLEAIRDAKKGDKKPPNCMKKGMELPYPPNIDCNEYIKCPHCLRQFNKPSAERHIAACAKFRPKKYKQRPLERIRDHSK